VRSKRELIIEISWLGFLYGGTCPPVLSPLLGNDACIFLDLFQNFLALCIKCGRRHCLAQTINGDKLREGHKNLRMSREMVMSIMNGRASPQRPDDLRVRVPQSPLPETLLILVVRSFLANALLPYVKKNRRFSSSLEHVWIIGTKISLTKISL
jgi:hypothetical protein